jgi:hypothetical protein
MKIEQRRWTKDNQWEVTSNDPIAIKANLVMVFGQRALLSSDDRFNEIQQFYPNSQIVSCSTSGDILDIEVSDDTIVVTAIEFEKTIIKTAILHIEDTSKSHEAGINITNQLKGEGLKHIFVLSDGLKVNGSELVKGMNEASPDGVVVTGGLAGDGANFEETIVGLNATPTPGNIVAVGFYGDQLKVGYGSQGGWDAFGPERVVTKSNANVLYELDNESALALYKTYLGDKSSGLPGTGLLFPLSIKATPSSPSVVRTILAVDENENSITFAGDIPEGAIVQLMKASFDKLVDGALDAAELVEQNGEPELAILVSCVGRKIVLGPRIEEEVEEVQSVFGENTKITGFYSYGELAPTQTSKNCELHNQTMTITTFNEA